MEQLALCLDRERRLIPNWKQLSWELNVDSKVITRLQQYTDFSPTIRLFEHLEVSQPDLSILQLKTALLDIKRTDLFTLLTKGDYPNYTITRFRCCNASVNTDSAHPQAGLQHYLVNALRPGQMPYRGDKRPGQMPNRGEKRPGQIPYRGGKRADQMPYRGEKRPSQIPYRGDKRPGQMPQRGDKRPGQMPHRGNKRPGQMPHRGEKRPSQMPYRGDKRADQMPYRGDKRLGQIPHRGDKRPGQMPHRGYKRPGQMPHRGDKRPGQMPYRGDKRPGQMPHGAVKKDVDFFASGLTIILIKAYSHQTKSQIRLISQYCGIDRSFYVLAISFMSSPDIVYQERIVFAEERIIETKGQYWQTTARPPMLKNARLMLGGGVGGTAGID